MAKMKYEIITDLKLPDSYCGSYRYGKPEGIVLHEPANTGLIQNQIGYQLRNPAVNGIVHAWADDDELREISSTDYKCWGAGGPANARFAQIECCRFDDRARAVASIDRGLFWAAFQLFYYKLPCTDATQNGNGTVWTHAAVTKFLGNTDHVDPLPYWNSVGVTWSAAYAQIQKYFYALHSGDSTVVPALGATAAAPTTAPAPVQAAPAPTPTVKPASGWVREIGTFTPNIAVGVRSEPKDSSPVIATYYPGERVNYDSFMNDGTYVWVHYVSYRGANRYLKVRYNGTALGSFS